MHTHTCYTYIHACIHTCVHIYIYVCVYIYIYIHVYIHIQTCMHASNTHHLFLTLFLLLLFLSSLLYAPKLHRHVSAESPSCMHTTCIYLHTCTWTYIHLTAASCTRQNRQNRIDLHECTYMMIYLRSSSSFCFLLYDYIYIYIYIYMLQVHECAYLFLPTVLVFFLLPLL